MTGFKARYNSYDGSESRLHSSVKPGRMDLLIWHSLWSVCYNAYVVSTLSPILLISSLEPSSLIVGVLLHKIGLKASSQVGNNLRSRHCKVQHHLFLYE